MNTPEREALIQMVQEDRTFYRVTIICPLSERASTFSGENAHQLATTYKLGALNALQCAGYRVEFKDVQR